MFFSAAVDQESPNAGTGDDDDKEILDISVKGAVVFVITASTFLVLLYFFMSAWFVWLLIVLFCVGGVQVTQLLLCLSFMCYLLCIFGCIFKSANGQTEHVKNSLHI